MLSRGRRMLLLFPLIMLTCVMLALAYPHSYLLNQLTGDMIPVVGLGFVAADHAVRKREQRAKFKRRFSESLGKPPVVLPRLADEDQWRRDYDQLTAELRSGMLSVSEFRERWAKATALLEQNASARIKPVVKQRYPVLPAEQLEAISKQYGLPVTTALQKNEPLPLVTAPPVSASTAKARAQSLEDALGRVDAEEEMLLAARDPGPSPEAQAELSAELRYLLRSRVDDDVEVSGRRRTRTLRWFMSPEWLAEVRLLKDTTGGLLYLPRTRTAKWQTDGRLFGYAVTVGDAFGVPELREP